MANTADPQGPCETTGTPRYHNPDCKCPTYAGNLGPCRTYETGSNGRCVYCDHRHKCHVELFILERNFVESHWMWIVVRKCRRDDRNVWEWFGSIGIGGVHPDRTGESDAWFAAADFTRHWQKRIEDVTVEILWLKAIEHLQNVPRHETWQRVLTAREEALATLKKGWKE